MVKKYEDEQKQNSINLIENEQKVNLKMSNISKEVNSEQFNNTIRITSSENVYVPSSSYSTVAPFYSNTIETLKQVSFLQQTPMIPPNKPVEKIPFKEASNNDCRNGGKPFMFCYNKKLF